MTIRLQALKDRGGHDFWRNEDVRCPHCGNCINVADHEMWELYEEGEHEIECPYCELSMAVRSDVKYSFSTEDQPDDEDKE